jgi:hypothetical protein
MSAGQYVRVCLMASSSRTDCSVDKVSSSRRSTLGKVDIAPSIDGIHPPWLIRALNLGERIDDHFHVQNGIYNSLASQVLVTSGGIDIGSLCAFENLRELEAHLQEQRFGAPAK